MDIDLNPAARDAIEGSATFHPDRLSGRVLFYALLILTAAFCLSEVALRTLTKHGFLPLPAIHTGMPQFDAKLDRLETLFREVGRVDCIVIGSSMVDGGFDPQAFIFSSLAGGRRATTCFNFGINGLTAQGAGIIAQGLVNRYHPEVVLYITSARDYAAGYHRDTRELLASPQLGWFLQEDSIGSYLFQRSILFGWLSTPSYWTNREYVEVYQQKYEQMTSLGFRRYSKGKGIPEEFDATNLPHYNLDSQDAAGLKKIVGLADSHTRIVVVEMPVYAGYLPYYIKKDYQAYFDEFLLPVEGFVRYLDGTFIRTVSGSSLVIPDNGWKDPTHLNIEGAKIFSTWLAMRTITNE